MAKKKTTGGSPKQVEALKHGAEKRRNIPTAEYQSVMEKEEQRPLLVAYERRNPDLDPQLVWRGKDLADWSDLVVQAPPLFIQEKVHPKVLIDDLVRRSEKVRAEQASSSSGFQTDLFADFNGIAEEHAKTEFYQHDQNWTNRMILGDSLQVMASLAEREGLRGKVQCIYFDPPYGIEFNSNFQWSTKDRSASTSDSLERISREPEQVKAFRDTWRDDIHSYLSYLRDRLSVCRDLLTDSGSIFLQIGDSNVHRVRAILDEVFGPRNFVAIIPFRKKTMPFGSTFIEQMSDFILWYARSKFGPRGEPQAKFRRLYSRRSVEGEFHHCWYEDSLGRRLRMSKHQLYNHALLPPKARVYRLKSLEPSGAMASGMYNHQFRGRVYKHPKNGFGTPPDGMRNLERSNRLEPEGERLCYVLYADEGEASQLTAPWHDTVGADDKQYVVQTNTEVIKRCILMSTEPGDLVLDPTCGAGSTAVVAEQWGRRWISIDTSRVALALARSRVMGARFPFYLLVDSLEGQLRLAELKNSAPVRNGLRGQVRQGFVYRTILTDISVGAIARNSDIQEIWERFESSLLAIRKDLTKIVGRESTVEEWEIPGERPADWPEASESLIAEFGKLKRQRQAEIDASIASRAKSECLVDDPYKDNKKVRVAGPFTVESLSPHRTLAVGEDDELIDTVAEVEGRFGEPQDFATMILDNLRTAGVQQAHKEDKIVFTSLTPWPGHYICAEGRYLETESGKEKRAGIFIGPEFGTVSRPDLVSAAREAGDGGFDALIACAFSYEAHASEMSKLGRIPVLKARMNADLHMADELKNTGKGNLFVIFGEPEIELLYPEAGQVQVRIKGVDVFDPSTGEIRSDDPDGIACWFIDTDYNEESFFVRHAYFLGANDPYKSLKTTLKAEVDENAWASLHSDTSRPFAKPESGRIAVKVINHLGDEVMKVFRV